MNFRDVKYPTAPLIDQKIYDFVAEMDKRFETGESTCVSKTKEGDEYIELISLEQGKHIFMDVVGNMQGCRTADEAWQNLRKSFEIYAKDRVGKLYWRCLPEVVLCERVCWHEGPTYKQKVGADYYRGYMRLFIAET